MSQSRSTAPRVYDAIAAITAELSRIGIAKSQVNADERYAFRGIDDVAKALAPLLARHKLCVLPRVLERTSVERQGAKDTLLISVNLRMAFDLVSARDGSSHTIEVWGEALDNSDKATAKAMTSAYKHAMLQIFCIPVAGVADEDARSHQLKPDPEQPDPVQGWEQWSADLQDMVRLCETVDAIARVQNTYRAMLRTASKRRPDVFAAIGKAMGERRNALNTPPPSIKPANGNVAGEMAHA